MNYQKIYDSIISSSSNRGLNKKLLNYYTEKHHIIPKCMNGTNDKENLVLLTGREHYLCHWLLWKIHKTKQLLFAYHKMVYQKRTYQERNFKVGSKQYEILKSEKSLNTKGINNPFYGKHHSKETIKIIVNKNKGRKHSEFTKKTYYSNRHGINNGMFGKLHSNESKLKMQKKHNITKYKAVEIDGILFKSALDAAKEHNVCVKTIRNRCNNELFKTYKYVD